MTAHNGGRPAGLIVGVSVTGLRAQRAAAVAALAAGQPAPVPVWRHVAVPGQAHLEGIASRAGSARRDGFPAGDETGSHDGTGPRDGIGVLPTVVGVRLDELVGGFRPAAGKGELPTSCGLVLPVSYGPAEVVLDRLRCFAGLVLGVHLPAGSDRDLRQYGVTSDQALGDWLGAARGAGFSAVALWPVAFTIAGLAPEQVAIAAGHAARLAAMLAPVPR
jgi:hypothetical protein